TRTGADLRAYDPMTAKEFHVDSKEVHTAAFSFGSACRLTVQLGHTGVRAHPLGKGQAMVPVSRDERIIGVGRRPTTRRDRFLPDICMKKTADLTFHLIFFFCHQLKLTNELH